MSEDKLINLAQRQHALLAEAQRLLAEYLRPGGLSKRDVLDRLLALLDSPEALAVRDRYAEMARLIEATSE